MEKILNAEKNPNEIYIKAYTNMLMGSGADGFIELSEGVSKIDFLKWLLKEKGFLLHGSNNQEIDTLQPRQANCASKEFGNMKAVYAVEDCVLPTFYAIKDRAKFTGMARSGFTEVVDGEDTVREYEFAIDKDLIAQNPWSDGAVYILSRETFVQGHDNEGNPIDEWASEVGVIPLGKIKITPDDFSYLHEIKAIES